MKTYRELPYQDVVAYAEKHSFNIDTHENFREAAQALWREKYEQKTVDSPEYLKQEYQRLKDENRELLNQININLAYIRKINTLLENIYFPRQKSQKDTVLKAIIQRQSEKETNDNNQL